MKKILSVFIAISLFINVIAQEIKDIKLPAAIKSGGKPLMEALNNRASERVFSAKELNMQELSDLLWAADGINRPESGKRTAPTAMNWQDMEIYVILKTGIYKYNPKDHLLEFIKA